MKKQLKKIKQFFEKYNMYLLGVFFISTFIDLFYNAYFSDFFLGVSLMFWFGLSYFLGYKSTAMFKIVLTLLSVFAILYLVDQQAAHTERIVSHIVAFFLVGIVQQLIELKNEKKI